MVGIAGELARLECIAIAVHAKKANIRLIAIPRRFIVSPDHHLNLASNERVTKRAPLTAISQSPALRRSKPFSCMVYGIRQFPCHSCKSQKALDFLISD